MKNKELHWFKKLELFVLSMWLFFLMVIILTLDIPISLSCDSKFVGLSYLFSNNITPIICSFFLLWGVYIYGKLTYRFKGTLDISFEINNITSINYEHLAFLTTYIIPLVSLNFSGIRYKIVLCILLFAISIIYIKTDIYYANPTLAILGFKIYKADGVFTDGSVRNNIVLISKDSLSQNDRAKYIKFDNKVYFTKKNHE